MVGRVIGKGGETIKALQKNFGANIQIDQATDPMRVTVAGQPQAVNGALAAVQEIIAGGNPPFLNGPGGPGPFGGGMLVLLLHGSFTHLAVYTFRIAENQSLAQRSQSDTATCADCCTLQLDIVRLCYFSSCCTALLHACLLLLVATYCANKNFAGKSCHLNAASSDSKHLAQHTLAAAVSTSASSLLSPDVL